jgi:hypothetical protein
MYLYNQKITINGKKVGKVKLRNYLLALVKNKYLKIDILESNPGYSNSLFFYTPEQQNKNPLFDLSSSNNWSTFVSDTFDEKRFSEIEKLGIVINN